MSTIKEQLTPLGISNKLSTLYALSDSLLKAQAILIRDDFRNWMDDNFNMTTDQETYINGFSDGFEDYLSDLLYIAVKNRRPIEYTPIELTTDASKLLPLDNTFKWEYGTDLALRGKIEITATV